SFLKSTGSLVAMSAMSNISFGDALQLKTVLRGGKCFYQNKWQILDVGIDESGKLKIGSPNSLNASEIVDVPNKIVSPGFIDILADNAANPEKTYKIFE